MISDVVGVVSMLEPKVIETERLTLALPTELDVDDVYRACQDPEISAFVPALPAPYTRESAEWFVSFTRAELAADRGYHWAIRSREGFAGVVSLAELRGGSAELGYWLAPDARGQGFMAEAAGAALDFAFAVDGLRLERVEWSAIVGNTASARVARNLGFQYEGLRRQGLASPRGRFDVWTAALLHTDPRRRQVWDVLR